MDADDVSLIDLTKEIETQLNSILFSKFKIRHLNILPRSIKSLANFVQDMRNMILDTFEGSQNDSELQPLLPFWFNRDEKCTKRNTGYALPCQYYYLEWERTMCEVFTSKVLTCDYCEINSYLEIAFQLQQRSMQTKKHGAKSFFALAATAQAQRSLGQAYLIGPNT